MHKRKLQCTEGKTKKRGGKKEKCARPEPGSVREPQLSRPLVALPWIPGDTAWSKTRWGRPFVNNYGTISPQDALHLVMDAM